MQGTKKIIFFGSEAESLLNFRLHLMKEFQKKGYEVVGMAPANEKVANALEAIKIKFIPMPLQRNGLNPLSDILALVVLYKILKKEKPTAIFSYTIKPVIYGSVTAKLAHIPEIYSMITGTGYVFLNTGGKSRIVGFIARMMFAVALRLNRLVFFQNKDNHKFFLKKKLLSAKQATAIVNGSGVDCDAFVPVSYPNTVTFLMIARLLYDKGIREYLAAAKIISQKYSRVKFYLVGHIDTNPNSISQKELNQWVQEGCIEYLGSLPDVRPAIAKASIYVLPSYHEGTPRTVLEAMAMARPIITTDTAGCRETVEHNQNGFLIPVKSIDALARAMEQFIVQPDLIKPMGAASRALALEKYDVNKVNASVIQAIEVK